MQVIIKKYDVEANERLVECITSRGTFNCFTSNSTSVQQIVNKSTFMCLYTKDIMRTSKSLGYYKLDNGYWGYEIVGELLEEGQVKVEECLFILDSLIPQDLNVGEKISFYCKRIDF